MKPGEGFAWTGVGAGGVGCLGSARSPSSPAQAPLGLWGQAAPLEVSAKGEGSRKGCRVSGYGPQCAGVGALSWPGLGAPPALSRLPAAQVLTLGRGESFSSSVLSLAL
jgi:hypothetical protein